MSGTRDGEMIKVVLELFQEQGADFKMDDVAKAMKISKKTIYKTYGNKEALIMLIVNAVLEGIAHQVTKALHNDAYDLLEKLLHVTCSFPDINEIDYHKALLLKNDFPKPYQVFMKYISDNWALAKSLFDRAISEGLMRPVEFSVFRTIIMGITQQVLEMDIEDQEAYMTKCVKVVIDGLRLEAAHE